MSATQVIYTVWLRDIKWFIRARIRIIQSVVQPFLWLAIIGVGLSSFIPKLPGGESYLAFMAPGIIGMTIIFASMFQGVAVLWDKQFGFMKEMLVAPVARTQIMLGKALGGVTVAMVPGLLLLVAAGLVGVWPPSIIAFVQVVVFMVLIGLAFVSLGLAFASRMTDPIAFPLVLNFLVLPLFFLSGALFPIKTAPSWMQAIAYFNPLMYGVDGIRGAMIVGGAVLPLWADLGVLVAFSGAMVILGGYLFGKATA